jgi:hypothetical protein
MGGPSSLIPPIFYTFFSFPSMEKPEILAEFMKITGHSLPLDRGRSFLYNGGQEVSKP